MVAMLVPASLPNVTVHAHADAAIGHHDDGHAGHVDHDDELPVDDTDQPASSTSLHVHDASLAFAPIACPVLAQLSARHNAPATPISASPGGLPVPPLHRPPIA